MADLTRIVHLDVPTEAQRARITKAVQAVEKALDMYDEDEDEDDVQALGKLTQWTTSDDVTFVPASKTRARLAPGAYEICVSQTSGIYFEKVSVKITDLVRFPDSNSDRVISEIRLFWDSQAKFKKYKMPYKRGICLWGPPGSGKSCTVQFVMKDVVDRGGIIIKFYNPDLFLKGYRIFREIEPTTPVVVIMEDVDSILEDWSESSVLNILDGAVDDLDNVVFLATTNYPEKLGARVINRPSRFDRRFKIGFPGKEARRIYFSHLFKEHHMDTAKVDIEKWISDTEDMSIAHLRELFVAVMILDNDYEDALGILQQMDKEISSSQDKGVGGIGFG
jgi:AAA+ superfamily predicted ATPase